MDTHEAKLGHYIKEHHSTAEQLIFPQSCRSVQEAANAAKASPEDFIKTIVFVTEENIPVIAIIRGVHKADPKKVSEYIGEEVHIAKPEEVEKFIGYPAGGVPPIGFEAKFLIDPEVMKMEAVYAGGGSDKALLKISTQEILQFTNAEIVDVKKD